jgi:predicted DNA-binding protein
MSTMTDLVLTLSPEAAERLEALAAKIGKSVDDCAQQALSEFMDNWEDYLRTVENLDNPEERPTLRAVND